MSMCGVYMLLHRPSGQSYVGSSKNIDGRVWAHFNDLQKNQHHSKKLWQCWVNSFPEEWAVVVLEECSFNILRDREQHYIDVMDSCLNTTKIVDIFSGTGDFWRGRKHTLEAIQKMSKTTTGMKTGPCSEERKKKVADALRGIPLTEERKRNISLAKKGKPLTVKQKAHLKRLHQGMCGRIWTEEEKEVLRGIPKSKETRQRMKDAWVFRKAQKLLTTHKEGTLYD